MHSLKEHHVPGMNYTDYDQVIEVCRLADRTLVTTRADYAANLLLPEISPSHAKIIVEDLSGVRKSVRVSSLNEGHSKVLDETTLAEIQITQQQEKQPKGAATTLLVSSFI